MISFFSANFRWIAGGFLLTFFSSFGQTYFISLSASNIRNEYGLSHGDFGFIYMLATLASALTLPWLGKIVDIFSPARVTLIIIPLLALGCVGMVFSTHIYGLVVTLFCLRLFGQGMMTQNALTATGRWFAANRGRAVSLVTLGHNTGEALLPIIFVALSVMVGWRNVWLMGAIFLIVFALPLIIILIKKEREPVSELHHENSQPAPDWTRQEVLRDPFFWLLLTGVLAPPFIGTTIFFHQVYLVELRGWSLEVFALSFVLMSVSVIIFVLIAGMLVDRFSALRILPIFLLPLSFACICLGLLEAQWSAFLFMILLGISYGFSSTLFGAVWPEAYGTKHLGSIRAVVVAIMVCATAIGPGLTGFLIDKGVHYPDQITAMGVYCLTIGLLMVFSSRRLLLRRKQMLENFNTER